VLKLQDGWREAADDARAAEHVVIVRAAVKPSRAAAGKTPVLHAPSNSYVFWSAADDMSGVHGPAIQCYCPINTGWTQLRSAAVKRSEAEIGLSASKCRSRPTGNPSLPCTVRSSVRLT
jgi:hypothetical protein